MNLDPTLGIIIIPFWIAAVIAVTVSLVSRPKNAALLNKIMQKNAFSEQSAVSTRELDLTADEERRLNSLRGSVVKQTSDGWFIPEEKREKAQQLYLKKESVLISVFSLALLTVFALALWWIAGLVVDTESLNIPGIFRK